MSAIDWRTLAGKLGTISWTEHGRNEQGGTRVACDALIAIVGDEALRDAVDFYVSGEPGHEVARSVLLLLRPPVAMERCIQIFRTSGDPQQAADAINLLQVVADRRALEWLPEILSSNNDIARAWGIGVVDQLLIMNDEIEREDAMPMIQLALADPYEPVRARAEQIVEWLEAA